jgi:ligand-binding sensor domain-containing protein/signal transduction histidine kinase
MIFRCHRLIRQITLLINLLLTGFGLFSVTEAYGQQNLLQFKHLTTDDGLSSSTVMSVVQDYKGFMWFGTDDGLNRYDGNKIVVYRNNPSDSNSLIENHIHTIFEDREKNLLIGTRDGLVLYDRKLDRFNNYKFDKSSSFYNVGFSVNQMVEDSAGNLWLATSIGLMYFNRATNTIKRYQHDPNDPGSISFDEMDCVYIDKLKRLWVATKKGLNLFVPESGTFKHIDRCVTHTEDVGTVFFLAIIEDNDGNIWFGSSSGLFCLEAKGNTADMVLTHFLHDPKDPLSLSINRARSLLMDENGQLWIGTENGGLNVYNNEKRNFYHYRIDDFNPMSLNNESIQSLTQDRQKNLWIGTYGGGVNVSMKNGDFLVHYKNLPGAQQSLSHNNVSYFVQDRLNRIWVATDGGGFNLFNDTTGRFIHYNSQNTPLQSNAVLCMQMGEGNQIWMGTWEGGLINFDCVNKRLKSFTTKNSGITDNTIYSIAKDMHGNLWCASFTHGLIKYQIKENTFVEYSPNNSLISGKQLDIVKTDRYGNVFIGANSRLQIFVPSENRFSRDVKIRPDTTDNRTNVIYDVLIENDSSTWVATQNGLFQYNQATEGFRWYFKSNGLPSNLIRGVAIDKSGILWVTTNNGLCRFDRRDNRIIHFTKSDGLQGNEFTKASVLTNNAGKILAGGSNGFNLISPDKYSVNQTIPEVVLTDFHISNEPVNVGSIKTPLSKQISETRKMTLSYKQSVLTFYFAVLDFTNPDKNKYAYWMENFDRDWTYCGNRNNATYTNLDPGAYRFHVKGANNDGVWNETGTTLEIIITPPWWKTKIALFCFIALCICSFLWIYFDRINKLEKQKNVLEKLVNKRTREIEEKNERLNDKNILLEQRQQFIDKQSKDLSISNDKLILLNETKDKFFSIIAHDLKNPFSSIFGFCEILSRRYETMNDTNRKKAIDVIYDSSRKIFKLLENLLQWARSQTGAIKYEPAEFMLDEVVATNILLLENMALQKKLKIRDYIESGIKVFADKNMVDTVIRNLITNAIKFTDSGWIGIETIQEKDYTKVKIIDTGVGISIDKLDKLFNVVGSKSTYGTRGEPGTGLGLILCKEFVQKHGGTIGVESELGKGSTIYFTIPTKSAVN